MKRLERVLSFGYSPGVEEVDWLSQVVSIPVIAELFQTIYFSSFLFWIVCESRLDSALSSQTELDRNPFYKHPKPFACATLAKGLPAPSISERLRDLFSPLLFQVLFEFF